MVEEQEEVVVVVSVMEEEVDVALVAEEITHHDNNKIISVGPMVLGTIPVGSVVTHNMGTSGLQRPETQWAPHTLHNFPKIKLGWGITIDGVRWWMKILVKINV